MGGELAFAAETVGILKGVADLTKSLRGIKDSSAMHSKVSELQTQILAAQSSALSANEEQFDLLQRVRGLEGEVRELKDWDRDKENYELKEVASGVFAYGMKPGVDAGGLAYYLCANCYERRIKSVLQKEHRIPRAEVLACNTCGSDLYITGMAVHASGGRRK